jgi:hypothetical protein
MRRGHPAKRYPAKDPSSRSWTPFESSGPNELQVLVYELLDAHSDTAQLAASLVTDPDWNVHLQYLRALQREGREILARAYVDSVA